MRIPFGYYRFTRALALACLALFALAGNAQAGIMLSNDSSFAAATLEASLGAGEVGSDDQITPTDAEELDCENALEALGDTSLNGNTPSGNVPSGGAGNGSGGMSVVGASFFARIGEVPTQSSNCLICRLVTFARVALPTPCEGRLFRPPRAAAA
jgi:hypothetical protein